MRRAAAELLALLDDGPACVPELLVTDLAASLRCWRDVLGFTVLYDRPEAGFAMLAREGAWIMLDQINGEDWLAGPLERPFGRGLNLEFTIADVDALHARARAHGLPIFLALHEKHYRIGSGHVHVRQFIVSDPDGYLLRFSQSLGAD